MKLAIVGYGKMGRLVEQHAPAFGFEVTAKFDEHDAITAERVTGVDAAIEFTAPAAAVGNIETLCALRIPVVVGTTGWTQHLPHVRAVVERTGGALVWSPNYSIGVQVFFRVAAEAARMMAGVPEYEAWVWEIHHSAKKDAPSGTLEKLVAAMRAAGYAGRIDASSNRAGAHPGTHEIGFDSAADTITLRHTARSREGFARGALRAAQWIAGKKGCYEFSEILFGEAG
ncbi:MAG TPA: dihydrodipicolinate reductase [Solibacterales bacterium]|nr:dihydrodipicolinate reductase [Bryobacterales bacterium]